MLDILAICQVIPPVVGVVPSVENVTLFSVVVPFVVVIVDSSLSVLVISSVPESFDVVELVVVDGHLYLIQINLKVKRVQINQPKYIMSAMNLPWSIINHRASPDI